MVKKAVILVAGREKKLAPLTDEMHQCLFNLGTSTVIEDMLDKLSRQGIKEVVLVVGHKAGTIHKRLGDKRGDQKISYVLNREYESTHVLYSLWLARQQLRTDFLLIDGDIICEEELLEKAVNSSHQDLLAIDMNDQALDGKMTVKVLRGRIRDIGIRMKRNKESTYGRSIGIAKFSQGSAALFLREVDRLVEKGIKNAYYEEALANILPKTAFAVFDVSRYTWIEIDETVEFEKAKKIFGDVIDIKKKALEYGADAAFSILPADLIYDDRALLKCFNCSKYNLKWTCPPKSPMIDYRDLMMKYKKGVIVAVKAEFTAENYEKIRVDSSNKLHRILLKLEKDGFNQENHFTISFIGGSCKLCAEGCAEGKCRNPQASRIPIEATGIDIVRTLSKFGLELKFPVRDYLYRVGLLLVG